MLTTIVVFPQGKTSFARHIDKVQGYQAKRVSARSSRSSLTLPRTQLVPCKDNGHGCWARCRCSAVTKDLSQSPCSAGGDQLDPANTESLEIKLDGSEMPVSNIAVIDFQIRASGIPTLASHQLDPSRTTFGSGSVGEDPGFIRQIVATSEVGKVCILALRISAHRRSL